jgi:hypothetical protein
MTASGLLAMPISRIHKHYLLWLRPEVVHPVPVDFTEFVRAIADLSVFGAVLNEPPPGSQRYVKPK